MQLYGVKNGVVQIEHENSLSLLNELLYEVVLFNYERSSFHNDGVGVVCLKGEGMDAIVFLYDFLEAKLTFGIYNFFMLADDLLDGHDG